MEKTINDKGRVVYCFPEEECEVPICLPSETAFIEHFMNEGYDEEECVRVIGGIDMDCPITLCDAFETWTTAWEKASTQTCNEPIAST